MLRVPTIRRDPDGTIIDGTALHEETAEGGMRLSDFRDLEGISLVLPPGSRLELLLLGDDEQYEGEARP